jgi:hypothetical protein
MGTHEPRQVRKEATVSDNSHVPQGRLILIVARHEKPKEVFSSRLQAAFLHTLELMILRGLQLDESVAEKIAASLRFSQRRSRYVLLRAERGDLSVSILSTSS